MDSLHDLDSFMGCAVNSQRLGEANATAPC